MKGHTKRVSKQGTTWTYECSCGKVKKQGLKFEASADAMHAAHVKHQSRNKATN